MGVREEKFLKKEQKENERHRGEMRASRGRRGDEEFRQSR